MSGGIAIDILRFRDAAAAAVAYTQLWRLQILWNNIDRDAYDQFGRVDLTESS